MTKEELLEALTASLGKTGLSDRTVDDYATRVATLNAEVELTDAFTEAHAAVLRSVSGNLSHDIAAGIEDWKKQHPTADPKPAAPTGLEAVLSRLEAMAKEQTALKERLDGTAKEAAEKTYRESLLAELRKQGAKNEYLLTQAVAGKALDTEKPVAEAAGDYLAAYDAAYKQCFGEGAAPRHGDGGSGGGGGGKALDAFFSKKAAEGKMPKAD